MSVWAALAARRGELTVGDVSVFVAAVAGVQTALSGLVKSLTDMHHLLLMMRQLLAIVGAGEDSDDSPADALPLPSLSCGIEFRHLWFRYDEEHPWVLRGVNLFLPHSQAVALVGANGAGKSTLVKLLLTECLVRWFLSGSGWSGAAPVGVTSPVRRRAMRSITARWITASERCGCRS
ncbi:ATP-binding cassette domain-containing protein [Streptomyces atratus]|uniref:ATP-binding cassette domain-containing protein n=1 Tax=Streptomyces atratus TaxID=1893 RepID=UPI003570BDD3